MLPVAIRGRQSSADETLLEASLAELGVLGVGHVRGQHVPYSNEAKAGTSQSLRVAAPAHELCDLPVVPCALALVTAVRGSR